MNMREFLLGLWAFAGVLAVSFVAARASAELPPEGKALVQLFLQLFTFLVALLVLRLFQGECPCL